jgi:S-adenosylmethionine hydrolase
MTATGPITLLTDFGLDDPYVGVMKAVLLGVCPSAQIVDLCHSIAPYDKVAAAFWIARVFPWFPAGTVHIVVVDPEVGSARRALVLSACGQFFVGPDNGILSGIAQRPGAVARQIVPSELGLAPPSRTFHGRDVFAPVAARLLSGSLEFANVGSVVSTLCAPVLPEPTATASGVSGQVVTIDRFGNALTNIAEPVAKGRYLARISDLSVPVLDTYSDAKLGSICAIFGSFGTLELSQREGHAARALGICQGARVALERAP